MDFYDIDLSLRRYKINIENSYKYYDMFKNPTLDNSWAKNVINKSNDLRKAYRENEDTIIKIKSILDYDITKEIADHFYDLLLDLFGNSYDDYELLSEIANPLISFYESHNDYIKLINIYYLMGIEIVECFSGIKEYIDKAINYFIKVLNFKDKYNLIENKDTKHKILLSYLKIITFAAFDYDYIGYAYTYYNDAIKFINEYVKDKDIKIDELVNELKISLLKISIFVDNVNDEYKKEFFSLSKELYNKNIDDIEGIVIRAYYKTLYLEKEMDINIISIKLYEYFSLIKAYDNSNQIINDKMSNMFQTGVNLINYLELSTLDNKSVLISEVVNKINLEIKKIPHDYFDTKILTYCEKWFTFSVKYLTTYKEKEELLLNTIISRQIFTYLHSQMVSKIASIITEAIIENKPEIFVGFMNLRNVTDVKNNKLSLINYAKKAGLYHDVGKSCISNIINLQTRRLSQGEYALIRKHPIYGVSVLNNDKDFKKYFDVMLMHHKTYDGSSGYPINLDNTKSLYRIFIDIIKIADSIDAATDIFGRNYSIPKEFDVVFNELIRDKGYIYNPIIVDYINKDLKLKETLRKITGSKRDEIYYETISQINKNE